MEILIELILKNFNNIVGTILVVVLTAYFLWRNNFKSRRAAACAAFRAAILAELGSVYPKAPVWPDNIDLFLRSHFTGLQAAVENFRPFVPWWKRWFFENVWFRYSCSTGRKVDVQCYHHYMAFGDNPNYKLIFHSNVTKLLAFANET